MATDRALEGSAKTSRLQRSSAWYRIVLPTLHGPTVGGNASIAEHSAVKEFVHSRTSSRQRQCAGDRTGRQADAELNASIAALGLLEDLVIRTEEPALNSAEHYAMVARGRCLKAIQELAPRTGSHTPYRVNSYILPALHPS